MDRSPLLLLFVPGLGRRVLDGGAMPRLRSAVDPARRAGLVTGFPSLPASVEASALRGQVSGRHRVRLAADEPALAHPTVGELLEARVAGSLHDLGNAPLYDLRDELPGVLALARRPALADTARREGLDSEARHAAAAALDEEIADECARSAPDTGLLVVGGPALRGAGRKVALPPSLDPQRLEVESAILRVELRSAEEREEWREALLCCPGVERVLGGEALESWGAATSHESRQLYALAQEGWSFEEEEASLGHPECTPGENGVLLYLGARHGAAWPPELHEYRIAPSLARHFGLESAAFADRPFPL